MAIPILAIIFGFVFIIVKMAMDHERAKLSIKAGGDNSMTTSELKAMIEQAVQDAVAPLEKRIEELSAGSGERFKALPEAEKRLKPVDLDERVEGETRSRSAKQQTH